MQFSKYVEELFTTVFKDVHKERLSEKVADSFSGLAAGKTFTYATALKELNRMSSAVKVTQTTFGMFPQAVENKTAKPAEEAARNIQTNKSRGPG